MASYNSYVLSPLSKRAFKGLIVRVSQNVSAQPISVYACIISFKYFSAFSQSMFSTIPLIQKTLYTYRCPSFTVYVNAFDLKQSPVFTTPFPESNYNHALYQLFKSYPFHHKIVSKLSSLRNQ